MQGDRTRSNLPCRNHFSFPRHTIAQLFAMVLTIRFTGRPQTTLTMPDTLLHPADQEQGRWRSLVVAEPRDTKPTTRAAPLWPFVLGAILFSVLSAVSRKSMYDAFGTRHTFFRKS